MPCQLNASFVTEVVILLAWARLTFGTSHRGKGGNKVGFVTKYIKWIMIITGAFTCTAIFAFVAPESALSTMFGADMSDPIADVIVRSFGVLVTIMGGMLIYGAFRPVYRSFILVVVGISKVVFIGLVLVFGSEFLDKVALTLVLDAITVILFAMYLGSAHETGGIVR